MNERIAKLHKQSTETKPYISSERAELITDFYQAEMVQKVSPPVLRGMALQYILTNKALCVNDGELIVGERGPAPKATPTYPELCCHTLEDFEIMNRRDRTTFEVSDQVKKAYPRRSFPSGQAKRCGKRSLQQ